MTKKRRKSSKVTVCQSVRRIGIKTKSGKSAKLAWMGVKCKKVSRRRLKLSYGPRYGRFGSP